MVNENIQYLYSLDFVRPGLDRIKKALELLDNPQEKLKTIHITGTNGKGSVCSMLSYILTKAGYKTGMYTSPHLTKINERIKINNKNIPDEELDELISFIRNKIKEHKIELTYFEFLTALAFYYFHKKNIDFGIIEVGLGGRLDATNVINPLAAVITNIEYEHQNYLGSKITEIAEEKAGIIKEKTGVITAAEGKALEVIKKISEQKKADLEIIDKNNLKDYELSLLGDFQKTNANVAVKTIDVLNNKNIAKISEQNIKSGLKDAYWPGRLEFVNKRILFDCAHNSAAIRELVKFLTNHEKTKNKKINLVFGVCDDKNYKGMIKQLAPLTKKVIIVEAKIKRALKAEVLEQEIKKYGISYKIIRDTKEAVESTESNSPKNELILITGSIYVVGEAMASLQTGKRL